MPVQFFASQISNPVWREFEALQPENPFATLAYAKSTEMLGAQAWVVGERGDEWRSACIALLRRGRLHVSLEIPSFPRPEDSSRFATGLLAFCRKNGVSKLHIGTFASPPVSIPAIEGEQARTPRQEFSLILEGDLLPRMGTNHRRNIKKATQAGVRVDISNGSTDCAAHVSLMEKSMDRRNQRGEEIENAAEDKQLRLVSALIDSGAGFLAKASHEGKLLSSILILRSTRGAYYHSAGTSPEGMALGASHFLIYECLCRMQADGCRSFYLGGASPGTGLERFKSGFGADAVQLETLDAYVGGRVRKMLSNFVEQIRSRDG